MIASNSGLTRYLQFLRRGVWIILPTMILTTTIAFVVSERQAKLYRSSVDVLLTSQALAANIANVQLGSSDPGRQAATQANLARSLPVIQMTLRNFKGNTVQAFLSHSSVSAAPNADILTFSVTNHESQLAQRLAESYAAAYTRYRSGLDTHALDVARRRLDVQLEKLRAANQVSSPAYGALLTDDQQIATIEALQELQRASGSGRVACHASSAKASSQHVGRCGLGSLPGNRTRVRSGFVEHAYTNPV